jgi:hypothetical protein
VRRRAQLDAHYAVLEPHVAESTALADEDERPLVVRRAIEQARPGPYPSIRPQAQPGRASVAAGSDPLDWRACRYRPRLSCGQALEIEYVRPIMDQLLEAWRASMDSDPAQCAERDQWAVRLKVAPRARARTFTVHKRARGTHTHTHTHTHTRTRRDAHGPASGAQQAAARGIWRAARDCGRGPLGHGR